MTPFDSLSNYAIAFLLTKTDFTDEPLGCFGGGFALRIKQELEQAQNRKMLQLSRSIKANRQQKQFIFDDDFYNQEWE